VTLAERLSRLDRVLGSAEPDGASSRRRLLLACGVSLAAGLGLYALAASTGSDHALTSALGPVVGVTIGTLVGHLLQRRKDRTRGARELRAPRA